jgi:hypothetical protein
LPAAKSGQTYLWALKVDGGVPPYRCIPQKLGIGTLALTTACKITGTAPVVQSMSVTGPFHFKVQDSSSPKKTSEFPSMNFTVLGPPAPATPPPAPSGFELAASSVGNSANGWEAKPDPKVDNPIAIDVRVTGSGKITTDVYLTCKVGLSYPEVDKTFSGAGLFTLAVPAGSSNCDVWVASDRVDESLASFTVQIYVQTGAAPTPTPTPAPTPKPVSDTVTPATITLGSAGGCPGGDLTATIQIAAASNVSWTVKSDPNNSDIGQVVAGSGSGSGSFTVTINVPPQRPSSSYSNCSLTYPLRVSTVVDVKFSDGTLLGVTVNWTYIGVT